MNREHERWVERWARLGYATKGLVYIVIGVLAVQAAFTHTVKTTDSRSALDAIKTQPFGEVLLGIVAVGLAGYSMWRFVQAIADPEHKHYPNRLSDILRRIGCGCSGLAYGTLAVTAVQLLLNLGDRDEGNSTKLWVARVLSQPFGQWLVAIGGAVVLGVGVSFFYRTFKADFRTYLNLRHLSRVGELWVVSIGRFGLAARGIVFAIIGGLLIRAAHRLNPADAQSSEGALRVLQQQSYGMWLLGGVAIGLIAYGIHMGLQALFRKIDVT